MDESLVKGCGFCGSKALKTVIDFGSVGLAGAFLKPKSFPEEKTFPMHLAFCDKCLLLQVAEHVAPSEIFGDGYFYYSSSIQTLRDHFKAYAADMVKMLNDRKQNLVLEIGCNDGILLQPLVDLGCEKIVGIDPSTNVLQKISSPIPKLINDFFSLETAEQIVSEFGQAQLIMANNVFAHISDIQDFVRGVARLLADDGFFVFEVHYIRNLIEDCQYDMIYHEHLYNYSLLALQKFFAKFDLKVFDLMEVPIHAGSMRYYVKKRNNQRFAVKPSVERAEAAELELGYNKTETFQKYANKVAGNRDIILGILRTLKFQQKKIVGYGASGRANTILQYCDIDSTYLSYIVDDAPAKQGYFTPRTHIEIKPRSALQLDRPDYILCFAWSFMDEIAGKNRDYLQSGGVFIAPLPDPEFIFMGEDGAIVKKPWNKFLEITKENHASTGLGKRRDAGLSS